MRQFLYFLIITTTLCIAQDRSTIYNTGSPSGNEGYPINLSSDGTGHAVADRFTAYNNYVLEAFTFYASFQSDEASVVAQIHSDNNNSPGDVIFESVVTLNPNFASGREYVVLTNDDCYYLNKDEYYWLSLHAQDTTTSVTWIYSPSPYFPYTLSNDNGLTWQTTDYSYSGAGKVYGVEIYEFEQLQGDINSDNTLNVLDIVGIVGFIMETNDLTDEQQDLADMNHDAIINVLDIVTLVDLILNASDPIYQFLLEDINPNSNTFTEMIGPTTYNGQVSCYYFGKAG